MSRSARKGSCPRCHNPQCGWYQAFEPCQRSQEEMDGWKKPPVGCRWQCGEAGAMALGAGKGPHAAQWFCPRCDRWQSWVPRWRLALMRSQPRARAS